MVSLPGLEAMHFVLCTGCECHSDSEHERTIELKWPSVDPASWFLTYYNLRNLDLQCEAQSTCFLSLMCYVFIPQC